MKNVSQLDPDPFFNIKDPGSGWPISIEKNYVFMVKILVTVVVSLTLYLIVR